MHGIDFIQDLAVILVVAGAVGWICQRLGLSVVVGFLVAGMVVGPHTPPFSLVTDPGRIDTAAQIGLVFLMFGIGLKLSVRKLRRLGLALLGAVFASALILYCLTRLLGDALGWPPAERLFLAGMLMISSSAIVGKILHETGGTHERAGQLAMSVSVLEDIVAVVMLTLLNSFVQVGSSHGTQVLETVGRLGAFIALAGIACILLVPWLLKRLSISAGEELQTVGVAGLLFGLALVAQRAGYSLALGAFLLGAIVADTPHRAQVERTFEGLRDVFTAVFFVAIGMEIDPSAVTGSAGLIIAVAAFTFAARTLAVTSGLTLIGITGKDALRAGLAVTPIGEFSFIIAQLGVTAAVVPARFTALAVGVSLLTTLVAPGVARRSGELADWILARQPRWLETGLNGYRDWLEHLQRRQDRNLLWQLSRKRIVQVGVGMLFVTGLVVFSSRLFTLLSDHLGANWLFPNGLAVIFWAALVLVTLAPLVAIWRNLSAMAMLYAEISSQGHPRQRRLRPMVETCLKLGAGAGLGLWLMAILPTEGTARWLLLVSALLAVAALVLLRRKFIYWHSEFEVDLHQALAVEGGRATAPWLRSHGAWDLHASESLLPDLADCRGKTIVELDLRARAGCSVVGIERQGFTIALPPPETALYPRDKVLLLGTREQIQAGKKILEAVSDGSAAPSAFEEASMESLVLPASSRGAERTLAEVAPAQGHGILVLGLSRGDERILNPRAQERLLPGDEILVLGTPDQIRRFRAWLREDPPLSPGEAT